jgi:hypothetical protein
VAIEITFRRKIYLYNLCIPIASNTCSLFDVQLDSDIGRKSLKYQADYMCLPRGEQKGKLGIKVKYEKENSIIQNQIGTHRINVKLA